MSYGSTIRYTVYANILNGLNFLTAWILNNRAFTQIIMYYKFTYGRKDNKCYIQFKFVAN